MRSPRRPSPGFFSRLFSRKKPVTKVPARKVPISPERIAQRRRLRRLAIAGGAAVSLTMLAVHLAKQRGPVKPVGPPPVIVPDHPSTSNGTKPPVQGPGTSERNPGTNAPRLTAEQRRQLEEQRGRRIRSALPKVEDRGHVRFTLLPEKISLEKAFDRIREMKLNPSTYKREWDASSRTKWEQSLRNGSVVQVQIRYVDPRTGKVYTQTNFVTYEKTENGDFFSSGPFRTNDPAYKMFGPGWTTPSELPDFFAGLGSNWSYSVSGVFNPSQ